MGCKECKFEKVWTDTRAKSMSVFEINYSRKSREEYKKYISLILQHM